MPAPKINSVDMGTTNHTGQVRGTPRGPQQSLTAARASGVELQAQALARQYIAADGGPTDLDRRDGFVETANDHRANHSKGWRQVGFYDEEIWQKESVQENSRFRYDPRTGQPQEFQGARNYDSQEYYRDHRGQEPVLDRLKGTQTLNIRWGGNGAVSGLEAVNDRQDFTETVSLKREGDTLDYTEARQRKEGL